MAGYGAASRDAATLDADAVALDDGEFDSLRLREEMTASDDSQAAEDVEIIASGATSSRTNAEGRWRDRRCRRKSPEGLR